MAKSRTVKVKSRCCKSGPRCKRCPAALKKLERRGLATRKSKRSYVLSLDLTKSEYKAARAR